MEPLREAGRETKVLSGLGSCIRRGGLSRSAARRVEGPQHAGGVRRFVAPSHKLVLEGGEVEVGEGGGHKSESRRAHDECQAR